MNLQHRLYIQNIKNQVEEGSREDTHEKWSQKYKDSIDCDNPKGFSQRAHCQGKAKRNENADLEDDVDQNAY
jgi:hypothetical protein